MGNKTMHIDEPSRDSIHPSYIVITLIEAFVNKNQKFVRYLFLEWQITAD